MIELLCGASQAVKVVDCPGICSLKPVEKLSENIRSIAGRDLEHGPFCTSPTTAIRFTSSVLPIGWAATWIAASR